MKKQLSKAQEEVIESLKEGSYVWTNEGQDLKAWLGNERGLRIKGIRVKTVEILVDAGLIKLIDGKYKAGLYKYGLVKK